MLFKLRVHDMKRSIRCHVICCAILLELVSHMLGSSAGEPTGRATRALPSPCCCAEIG